jgi:hypothetical protein
MSLVGFESTTPAFERAKKFCVLDSAATAIGLIIVHSFIHSFIKGSTALCWTLAAYFSFVILYTVGRTWTGVSQSQGRVGQHKHIRNTGILASSGIGTHNPSVRGGGGRRQFVPLSTRPLWWPNYSYRCTICSCMLTDLRDRSERLFNRNRLVVCRM